MTQLVTVMCKAPTGLRLDLGENAKDPRVFFLRGANHEGAIFGAGMTRIPEDFWSAWKEMYAEYEPLKRGMIWAASREEDARAQASELKDVATGFEGLDPENPGKGINTAETKVEPTDEQRSENAKIAKNR